MPMANIAWAEDKPLTGPQTEKRFPPLQVGEGFRATLFACDPLVEYPSVIALGPRLRLSSLHKGLIAIRAKWSGWTVRNGAH